MIIMEKICLELDFFKYYLTKLKYYLNNNLQRSVSHNGNRKSTAQTYLKKAIRRPNLTVITSALVQRIHIENKKATGVYFVREK